MKILTEIGGNTLKEIHVEKITEAIRQICINAGCDLGKDVQDKLEEGLKKEESDFGKYILNQILQNIELSRTETVPLCQDTGVAVIYVDIGQDVHIVGGNITDAINEGVAQGYRDGYLRKSVVKDPVFERVNTGNNTPAIINFDIVPGDQVKLKIVPKGAGSENMCALKMLKPADGLKGVVDFVLETVLNAGANPCPPIIVGVGIGGTMEKAAAISKKAIARRVGSHHPREDYAALESELLEAINKSGIGPQGLGGRTTALAVNIETYPTHIACLPVAVSIQCHAARVAEVVL